MRPDVRPLPVLRSQRLNVILVCRRTGEQNFDCYLFHQRACVVSWHQGVLCLAEPPARKDLGCHDARGESLDGDGMPEAELTLTMDRL